MVTLSIKSIQFSDDDPTNPYFECAPFEDLTSPTHVTFAVTVDDNGSGWDFWGQAVLLSHARRTPGFVRAEGQMVVSRLDHIEVTQAVREHLARFENWIALTKDDHLIFEDGE